MATNELSLTELARYELAERIRQPIASGFGYGYKVLLKSYELAKIGSRSDKGQCDHVWETVRIPGRCCYCPQSGGWVEECDRFEDHCMLCYADRKFLQELRETHPDLFPHEDRSGNWQLPGMLVPAPTT